MCQRVHDVNLRWGFIVDDKICCGCNSGAVLPGDRKAYVSELGKDVNTHAHTHAHARARARAHTHTHTHARTRTHARMHASARTYARTHTHTHTHTPVSYTHLRAHETA